MAKPGILTINGGSSSIKFAFFELSSPLKRALEGKIERIGSSEARFFVKGLKQADKFSQIVPVPDYKQAAVFLIDWLEKAIAPSSLAAIGHRIVHGGSKYCEAQKISAHMIKELLKISAFDPEHLPEEILLAKVFHHRFNQVPQVACFDTAFHHDMPRVAQMLAIPRFYEHEGVRRYGFHGLSYEYLCGELARLAGSHVGNSRVILAHLGNGASLAALKNGKSIDTSMGFTPTSGVPMSTRSGDLDPGLFWYLAHTHGFDAKKINEMVNSKSGLLGISETSSDMRDLLERESDDLRAAEAIALFCYQVKKFIGAFAAALGGLDTLVFAGGIGENEPVIRARICQGLEFLGIKIEEERNALNTALISISQSKVAVRVIRTDEELIVAKTLCRVLGLEESIKP